MTARSLAIGPRSYPLVLPNLRDPRLHVAAVIISVHVLGQVALHFRVSVAQILAAIITCAIIEVALTFRQSRAIVWPASAMLTGSGVALILRVVGTPADQPWTTSGWEIFAVVAGLSLLTKYVIRYRGSHVFNPSNIGLVVAFVLLGSSRIEPLDFWWAPLNPGMIAAYAVIVGGGLLITRRLHLLALAAAYWLALAAGIGVLAASGHCMTANWAFAPVCGFDYWRTIVTSPEVMIFLFFMITDPKTVPAGRVGRVAFGLLVALACTLLMAPMTDEFGSKVALLSGLVLVCLARPLIDRVVPQPKSAADELSWFARLGPRQSRAAPGWRERAGSRSGGRDLAGRHSGTRRPAVPVDRRPQHAADCDRRRHAATDQHRPGRARLRSRARRRRHAGGRRDAWPRTWSSRTRRCCATMPRSCPASTTATGCPRCRLESARPRRARRFTLSHYHFDSLAASLLIPFGQQTGLSLGLHGKGSAVVETYGPRRRA